MPALERRLAFDDTSRPGGRDRRRPWALGMTMALAAAVILGSSALAVAEEEPADCFGPDGEPVYLEEGSPCPPSVGPATALAAMITPALWRRPRRWGEEAR